MNTTTDRIFLIPSVRDKVQDGDVIDFHLKCGVDGMTSDSNYQHQKPALDEDYDDTSIFSKDVVPLQMNIDREGNRQVIYKNIILNKIPSFPDPR